MPASTLTRQNFCAARRRRWPAASPLPDQRDPSPSRWRGKCSPARSPPAASRCPSSASAPGAPSMSASSRAERAPLAEVLRVLFEAGGSVIDSSPMYGAAEGVVGDLLAARRHARQGLPRHQGVDLGPRSRHRPDEAVAASCSGPTAIDLMQIHNLLDWRTHLPTLRAWKARRPHPLSRRHALHRTARTPSSRRCCARRSSISCSSTTRSTTAPPSAACCRWRAERGIAVIVNQPFGGGGLLRRPARPQAAGVGRRDRLRELGAVAAQVRPGHPGRHLRHPRHRQARAHARQCPRGHRPAARRGAAPEMIARIGG